VAIRIRIETLGQPLARRSPLESIAARPLESDTRLILIGVDGDRRRDKCGIERRAFGCGVVFSDLRGAVLPLGARSLQRSLKQPGIGANRP
jgi:hypothetical protein